MSANFNLICIILGGTSEVTSWFLNYTKILPEQMFMISSQCAQLSPYFLHLRSKKSNRSAEQAKPEQAKPEQAKPE